MEEKVANKKMWSKIGSGVLFIISCFLAMYILMQFHESVLLVIVAALLLLISAFLFLNAVFSDKAKEWSMEMEEKQESPSASDGEFRLKITKHMKEMESTQKELIDVLKNQNAVLKNQIDKLGHDIAVLSEKQANQAKTIIKFNKENARQLAISERETLEHVMQELKKAIEDNAGAVAVKTYEEAAAAEEPIFTGFEQLPEEESAEAVLAALEEVSEDELFVVSEFAGDDVAPVIPESPEPVAEEVPDFVIPEIPETPEIPDIPADIPLPEEIEMPADIPLPEEIEIPEIPADIEIPLPEEIITESEPEVVVPVPEPETAPIVEEAPAPAAAPVADLSSSDPGAMMTPEDIAKLLESMGN